MNDDLSGGFTYGNLGGGLISQFANESNPDQIRK
jgi:hypothetical protein